ncbi:DUF805 domain-containing protein [Agarivorans sp. 1_MG-2023]|uniref:DUF805 domain-containing protein n=1 Tax=unclassified Agarivorans TaxID=2636026 RepID=UPI0026E12672|nr:DUF805 domain-containing protein [Agarivorans sp. 1_MG-2023]MDO6762310.1 DUF805 domain-containing protein [Agarivorans sp. 1_MG-2023]
MNFYILAWQRYFDFSGYSTKQEFWMFMLIHCLICLALIVLAIAVPNAEWLDTAYNLVSFIPMVAAIVRRLHDTGKPGWWSWIFVLPIAGPFILVYLLCLSSVIPPQAMRYV